VLLEGGGELNAAFLRVGLIDDVRLYVAPALMGGARSIGVIGGVSPARPSQAVPLRDLQVTRLGADVLIQARVAPGV
jgi:diaminohydroxyphosphoribosylaminopyrimidine deaminase/5-amino-6-(5-phosphoribosylamino)uracil reductase